jgi:ABC-2 type transport system ATP-binding protein
MIEIEALTKAFGAKVAVDNLTLTVPTGRLFAFLGPNGAGKTTTIKLLVGLLHPTSGRMRVCGHDVTAEPQEVKRLVSYVPDQPFLYDKLSGREFLDFVAEMYGIPRKEYQKKAAELIGLFEMESYLDELSEGYSHGMRQGRARPEDDSADEGHLPRAGG